MFDSYLIEYRLNETTQMIDCYEVEINIGPGGFSCTGKERSVISYSVFGAKAIIKTIQECLDKIECGEIYVECNNEEEKIKEQKIEYEYLKKLDENRI
jgi:hypothetical protein